MTGIDPLLLNLVAAAERGETCPPLVLVVGTWIVQGQLVSSARFLEETRQHIQQRVLGSLRAKDRANPETRARATQIASEHFGPLGTVERPSHLALSFLDATLANSVTITVPTLRVPVGAVDSWWVTDHYVETEKRCGGGGGGAGFEMTF